MKKNGVLGAGGHARVVSSILRRNGLQIYGHFDDSCDYTGELISGAPLIGNFSEIVKHRRELENVYLAVGDNGKRAELFSFSDKKKFAMPVLVHPTSIIEKDCDIGAGSVICLGAILAEQSRVGRGCIINTGSSIDHESIVGDFAHIAPGVVVAGRTCIGRGTFIGLNSAVIDGITIGENVIVGAGTVVLKDIPDNKRVVGVWR